MSEILTIFDEMVDTFLFRKDNKPKYLVALDNFEWQFSFKSPECKANDIRYHYYVNTGTYVEEKGYMYQYVGSSLREDHEKVYRMMEEIRRKFDEKH